MKSFLAKETPLKRSIRESHLDLRVVASSAVVNCDRRDDGYNESGSKSKTGIYMRFESSISRCIVRLKSGDEEAIEPIWRRYYRRLVGLVHRKLHGKARRIVDGEDIALSAFDSFARGVKRGRFPELRDRNDLWRLILTIAERKAFDRNAECFRLKRGGKAGRQLSLSDCERDGKLQAGKAANRLEPTPEEAAVTAETMAMLLKMLDPEMQRLALGKLEGFTNRELANELSCSLATVERKLKLIRKVWSACDVFG
jgi:DNA-directed RNA polymerase specialized sigma24 family protein